MKMKIKALIFDIDSTLFDRKKAQLPILEKIVALYPTLFCSLKKEQILEAFLESDRIACEAFDAGAPSEALRDMRSKLFLKSLGLPENHADDITETYVREYPHVFAPVDGAVEIIEKAKRFKLGAVSNGLPDVQYRKLETLGIRDKFGCIILSEEVNIRKPDPRIFLLAVEALGLSPAECLFTGDSYSSDVVGAKGAGMYACWLRQDKPYPENPTVKADYVVNNFKEMEKILDNL
jgi:HAD superfamily hydrolase (TIGR01549 family)